jgi:uncharacterized protein YbjT (DUF2867 family)
VKSLIDDANSKHYGKTYTITGPEALTYYEVAEILSEATGKKINYVNISEEEARSGMRNIGIGDWWIETIIEVYQAYKSGIQSQVSPDVGEVTGNKARSFHQFAKDYAELFR